MPTFRDYINMAEKSVKEKDLHGAIVDATSAINAAVTDSEKKEGYQYRGMLHFILNEKANAIPDLKKAADYGSNLALEKLEALGINYTPQRSSSTPEKTKFKDKDGNTYEGYATYGTPNGKGKITYTDGDIYEGDWVDGMKHGKGKFTFADGDIYEGDYVEGKEHGKGKMTFTNGDKYEGDYVEGNPHGKGKYTYKNGDKYEGGYVDGKRHGKGKYTFANGKVDEGEWADGKFARSKEEIQKAKDAIFDAELKKLKDDARKRIPELLPLAKKGDAEAQYQLAECYGEIEKEKEAFKWYKKAAKQGHEGAKFSLGCCYIDGVGTFPIKFIGRKLIITSAEQGYAEAQEYLGTVYYVGHGGIYADYKKMVEWYTKAAAQGYADAIMKLARCYEDGDGVKEDKAKAAELYRQAAEGFRKMYKQGDIRAKWKLEKLTDDNKI